MKPREPSEGAIQTAVVDHWKHLGVPGSLVAAIPNARAHGQPGLTKGLPDLLVVGPRGVGFIELKTRTGKLSQDQVDIMLLFMSRGIDYAVTHGRDAPIEVLEQWGVVRKQVA